MSREISPAVERFILSHAVARLATADKNGQPHVIPFCYAFDGGHFYFVVDEKPKRQTGKPLKRIRNMLENPQVALVIDDYNDDWTQLAYVLVTGSAQLVEDESEYDAVLSINENALSANTAACLYLSHTTRWCASSPKKVLARGRVEVVDRFSLRFYCKGVV
jgi:PPOX class probable F420-dependent enzyme